jgi:hypothetical protein
MEVKRTFDPMAIGSLSSVAEMAGMGSFAKHITPSVFYAKQDYSIR